ncbi:hypothetical protein ACLESO_10475 [Pyxidicoccus sp. 3LG]
MAMSFLTREGLTAEERAFLEQARELSEKYGPYLLEAQDREDLQARIDAVIEDPGFHQDFQRLQSLMKLERFIELTQDLATSDDTSNSGLAQALGPAAVPALRRIDRLMGELGRCTSILLKGATPAAALPATAATTSDPLAFLGNPAIPVPVARVMLSAHRSNALSLAIGALRFSQKRAERWLGLAIAELFEQEARTSLALGAALVGIEVPTSILPPDERLELQSLIHQSQSVQAAYARFNTDAERSGEPVYPSVP